MTDGAMNLSIVNHHLLSLSVPLFIIIVMVIMIKKFVVVVVLVVSTWHIMEAMIIHLGSSLGGLTPLNTV